jgi:hypothetical protein
VQAVKRYLDALNEGLEQLAMFDVELTADATRQLRGAADVLNHHVDQLEQVGEASEEMRDARAAIEKQLDGSRPWRDIATVIPHVESIRRAYVAVRQRILATIGEQEEGARTRVKTRRGFATLTADQSHRVLRPIAQALPTTSDEAIAPGLAELRDGTLRALDAAEERTNELLDEILSEGSSPQVRKVELGLRNREVGTLEELDSVLGDLRDRVEPELRAGRRVRLVD